MNRLSAFHATPGYGLLAILLMFLVAAGCMSTIAKIAPNYMRVVDEMPTGDAADGLQYVPGITLPKGKVIYDCGPETVTAVFNYWGRPTTIDEVAAETYRVKDKGTLSLDLMLFARRKKFQADIKRGNLEMIQERIRRGTPPIIMLDVATLPIYTIRFADPKSKFHFLVVTGYNDRTNEIVCELYEGQKVFVHYQYLRKAWEKADFFLLTIVPPGTK